MTKTNIDIPHEQIVDFCRRNHIRKLSLFGSVVRGDFRPDSDVDVLVEFEPEYTPGLQFFAMQVELSQILGRPVDLNTPSWLSPRFLDEVQREQVPVYV
jgi:predicted nucleotidyltransferase